MNTAGLLRLALAGVILLLAGCSTVTAPGPLGLPVWSPQMQGFWELQLEGATRYYVRLLPDGTLRFASVDWDHKAGRFRLQQGDLVVSIDDGAMYVNLPVEMNFGKSGAYGFYRAMFSSGAGVMLFPPRFEVFADAIRSGALKGHIREQMWEGDEAFVAEPGALAAFVSPDRFVEQFDVDKPILLTHVGSPSLAMMEAPTVRYQGVQDHMRCLPPDLQEAAVRAGRRHARMEDAMMEAIGKSETGAGPEAVQKAWRDAWERETPSDGESPASGRSYAMEGDLITRAELSPAEFESYQACMQQRGYELLAGITEHARWVVKDGLGLFAFSAVRRVPPDKAPDTAD